jgi:hypothetical protein
MTVPPSRDVERSHTNDDIELHQVMGGWMLSSIRLAAQRSASLSSATSHNHAAAI